VSIFGQNLNTWTNKDGFNALYGGDVGKVSTNRTIGSIQMGVRGYYWSSTEYTLNPGGFVYELWITAPDFFERGVRLEGGYPYNGKSVRCVKD
jgi:hypothetical protein